MDLSIAIVSWNTRDLLDACLSSVYSAAGNLEIEPIVVDNASTDGSPELVRGRYPRARLIVNAENVGFARANNQALSESSGRYFLLLNPDTICLPGSLPALVRFLDETPQAGAVGPLVLNEDRTLQYSWARFPTFMSEAVGKLDRRIEPLGVTPITADETRELERFRTDWIGGCCLMIRREAVDKIGPMDESLFMYSEETDWCRRLRDAGWEVWVEPTADIIHLGGRSSRQVQSKAARYLRVSKRRYFMKHHGLITGIVLGAILSIKYKLRQLLLRNCG